jgi:hypothetical protein
MFPIPPFPVGKLFPETCVHIMRNGFETPEQSKKLALGLFLEKEPKQSRK